MTGIGAPHHFGGFSSLCSQPEAKRLVRGSRRSQSSHKEDGGFSPPSGVGAKIIGNPQLRHLSKLRSGFLINRTLRPKPDEVHSKSDHRLSKFLRGQSD